MSLTFQLGARLLALTAYLALLFWLGFAELIVFGEVIELVWYCGLFIVAVVGLWLHNHFGGRITHGFRTLSIGYPLFELIYLALGNSVERMTALTEVLVFACMMTLLTVLLTHSLGGILTAQSRRKDLEQQNFGESN
jgi:hypothetical protein